MPRKRVIEEFQYHERVDKSTIIYYDLITPVILNRFAGGFKVSLSEKIPQFVGHLNLATEVLKGFSPGVFNSP